MNGEAKQRGLSRRTVYLMLVLVMLLWSGNSIVGRAIRADVPPFTLALMRWTGASIIALPICWRSITADWELVKRHWRAIFLFGLLGVGSFNAFFYSGLQYTTAANSLLIQAAIPALVLVLNFLLYRDRPRIAQVAGCLVAATGVMVIVFQAQLSRLLTMRFNHGDILVMCAVLVWSLYTALLKNRPPVRGLTFLGLTALVGVIAMLPFSLFELQTHTVHMTPPVMAGVGYVILFPSILAYFMFNRAVEELGPADAGQVINLQPLFGAMLAILILGEPFHSYHIVGTVLILIGIAIPLLFGSPARQR